MDKRLLEQVQKALQAQQDTIERQEKMLDSKDEDIAKLTASLTKLAEAQTQELQLLPSRFEDLINTTKQFAQNLSEWNQNQKTDRLLQETSMKELITLSGMQIRLAELMNSYQSTIAPPAQLNSTMSELEAILKELKISQTTIRTMQSAISSSQDTIDKTQKLLTKELSGLEILKK